MDYQEHIYRVDVLFNYEAFAPTLTGERFPIRDQGIQQVRLVLNIKAATEGEAADRAARLAHDYYNVPDEWRATEVEVTR